MKMKMIAMLSVLTLTALTGCATAIDTETEIDTQHEQMTPEAEPGVSQSALTGVEPDEIDVAVDGTDDTRTTEETPTRKLTTYGPVITIKPKG